MTVRGIGMTKNVMLKQVQHDCEEKKRKEKEYEYKN